MLNVYTPASWFWLVAGDDAQAWSSASAAWVPAASADPARTTRIGSLADLDLVLRENALVSPIVTAGDVRAEAQRRIIALYGASSFDACVVRQLNALMRATELTNKAARGVALTADEQSEAAALQAKADAVKAIRARSNELDANPPADYRDDSRWT